MHPEKKEEEDLLALMHQKDSKTTLKGVEDD